MGLRNRQRGCMMDAEKRRRAIQLFLSIPKPATWADWELAKVRVERRAKREWREADFEMRCLTGRGLGVEEDH